jgi:hypothetical protein
MPKMANGMQTDDEFFIMDTIERLSKHCLWFSELIDTFDKMVDLLNDFYTRRCDEIDADLSSIREETSSRMFRNKSEAIEWGAKMKDKIKSSEASQKQIRQESADIFLLLKQTKRYSVEFVLNCQMTLEKLKHLTADQQAESNNLLSNSCTQDIQHEAIPLEKLENASLDDLKEKISHIQSKEIDMILSETVIMPSLSTTQMFPGQESQYPINCHTKIQEYAETGQDNELGVHTTEKALIRRNEVKHQFKHCKIHYQVRNSNKAHLSHQEYVPNPIHAQESTTRWKQKDLSRYRRYDEGDTYEYLAKYYWNTYRNQISDNHVDRCHSSTMKAPVLSHCRDELCY